MIVVRMKRADGPGVTLRIEDDSQLQRVMDAANRYFGDPLKVLPDPPERKQEPQTTKKNRRY